MRTEDTNIIPPHQLAMNRVAIIKHANGTIISAKTVMQPLSMILCEKRIITYSQLQCGQVFVDMRRAFLSRLDYSKIIAMLGDLFAVETEHPNDWLERLYLKVCRSMGRPLEVLILDAMHTETDGHVPLTPNYRKAFEELEDSFINAKKTLDEEIKT